MSTCANQTVQTNNDSTSVQLTSTTSSNPAFPERFQLTTLRSQSNLIVRCHDEQNNTVFQWNSDVSLTFTPRTTRQTIRATTHTVSRDSVVQVSDKQVSKHHYVNLKNESACSAHRYNNTG